MRRGKATDELRHDFPDVDFSALLVHSRGTPASTPRRRAIGTRADGGASSEPVRRLETPRRRTRTRGRTRADADGIWWYVDPDADQCEMTPEACRRDFARTVRRAERAARAAAGAWRDASRPSGASRGGSRRSVQPARGEDDPRGEELWLENCGVASYAVAPLAVPFRSPSAKGSAAA